MKELTERDQRSEMIARIFRLENLADSEMESRSRLGKHVERMNDRLTKLEEALNRFMVETREEEKHPPTSGTPLAEPVHVAGNSRWEVKSGTNDGGIAFINIDPKASLSGIPFSVALEYLKAGRKVRRPCFAPWWCWVISAGDITSLEGVTIHPQSKEVLATDWMVVPE